MSLPAAFMLAVVLLVGVPSAVRVRLKERPRLTLRNPTAAALVISWAAGEWAWLRTGNNLPLGVYFGADLFVMSVICLKAWARRNTGWDAAVMLIFPMMWLYYFDQQIGLYHKWYALYFLLLAQFLAAGAEPFFAWLEPRLAKACDTASPKPDNPSSGREFRWTRGRTGYA
jgi:hypothetical protein